jgi:lysophospholipase L1-like esterase
MGTGSRRILAALLTLGALFAVAPVAQADWVGAWGASMQPYPYGVRPDDPVDYLTAQSGRPADQTLRIVTTPTISGPSVRIRLTNAFGENALRIGAATVARRSGREGGVDGATITPVTFNGARGVDIAPGATLTSDPAPLAAVAGDDLAVSLWVAGTAPKPSWHPLALVTNFISSPGAGNLTGVADSAAFSRHLHTVLFLTGLEVDAPPAASTLVALGDSITDGDGSTPDGHDRWIDRFARRLGALRDRPPTAVVNAGISGNTAGPAYCTGSAVPACAPPVSERLDRDVLGVAGARSVLLLAGSNDIASGGSRDVVIDALRGIAARIRAAGMRVIGATIIPRDAPPWYSPSMDKVRNAVNGWIRSKGGGVFDGVVDFDAVMRAGPGIDSLARDKTDDDVHPNRRGHEAMAAAIDPDLFGSARPAVAGDASVRATRHRAVVAHMRCAPWAWAPCTGTATVTSKGRTLGSAAYRAAPGAVGRVRVPVAGLKRRTRYVTVRLDGDATGQVSVLARVTR